MQSTLSSKLIDELSRIGIDLKFDEFAVHHFDSPDKSDPFNLRSVLACTAMVDGKRFGWSVHIDRINKDSNQIMDLLIKGLANKMRTLPEQTPDMDVPTKVG